MNKTKIEYLTHSWNPIAMKCTPVSEGCKHCWHLDINKRFSLHSGLPELRQKELNAPLKLKNPSRIGVQFMGDLFHDDVEWNWLYKIFEIMLINPDHTYVVLTKRPKRMQKVLPDIWFHLGRNYGIIKGEIDRYPFPLKNLWLGVTCENQKTADERIPIILDIPAAVRFVSCEPCLEEIDLRKYLKKDLTNKIDWCIVGAENAGHKSRKMKESWVRKVISQCKKAKVPVFYKQQMMNGKKIAMPFLDGKQYAEYPQTTSKQNDL